MFLWFFPSLSAALDPSKAITQYKLDIWQVERGLPNNSIYAITQDRQGYLWLGTLDGLVRFDGVRFKVFNKQNTPQFKSNYIRALCEGRDGTLWIGSKDGGLLSLKQGEFRSYPLAVFPSINTLRALHEDRAGRLWIATDKNGVSCLHREILTSYSVTDGIADNSVKSIYEDEDQNLWFATHGGLTQRTPAGEFINHRLLEGMLGNVTYSVRKAKNGKLWVGGYQALHYLEKGKVVSYGLEDGLPHKKPFVLFEDSSQNLWIGTDGGGLVRFNGKEFETFSLEQGLANEYVFAIYEDREHSLWIATIGGGLHRLRDTRFANYSHWENLLDDSVNCTFADKSGSLWLGTSGGINRINLKSRKVDLAIDTQNRLRHKSIQCITGDDDGNIWFGTYSGLHRLKNEKITTFSTQRGLSHPRVHSLCIDRRGTLWIGTRDGLNRLENQEFTRFKTNDGPHNYILSILEDKQGHMWFGTRSGLYHLADGLPVPAPQPEGLKSSQIYCIYEDSAGILYFGTRHRGMFRKNADSFTQMTSQNGLPQNRIEFITGDNLGNLWLAGKFGISFISKNQLNRFAQGKLHNLTPRTYTEQDGLKSRKCNNGGAKTGDGRLWFCTTKGLEVINPAAIQKNPLPPPVLIETMTLDGERIAIGTAKTGKNTATTPPLNIPPGKERLDITYTALSFLNPQKILFKIKLDGYDRDWIDMGSRRNTTYTSLSPGGYTFRVMACNSDGTWNTTGASLPLYIQPLFYQTTWFFIFVFLFILLTLLVGHRLRVRNLLVREKELSRLVDIRTHALQEQTEQLGRAHQTLKKSNKIIEEKNEQIVSSLQYAGKIQRSLLPPNGKIKEAFEEHFLIYKPRDIVSGDFYWLSRKGRLDLVAVVDCTGHGVPGALLAMVGKLKLNEIVNDKLITDPAGILTELNAEVLHALTKEQTDLSTDSSMDMALVAIDRIDGTITFAGARRPLYYCNDSGFHLIKGTRRSIGGRSKKKSLPFENKIITFDSPTTIYLFSDGMTDQNNRENLKFGTRRLRSLLEANAYLQLPRQSEVLAEAFLSFRGMEDQRDDITFIGLKVERRPVPGHSRPW